MDQPTIQSTTTITCTTLRDIRSVMEIDSESSTRSIMIGGLILVTLTQTTRTKLVYTFNTNNITVQPLFPLHEHVLEHRVPPPQPPRMQPYVNQQPNYPMHAQMVSEVRPHRMMRPPQPQQPQSISMQMVSGVRPQRMM
eukprot:441279_1